MFSYPVIYNIITNMDKEQIVFLAGVTLCVLSIGAFIFWGPNPKPRRRGAVVGLQNLGLTCFLNTLLQALASCSVFVEWIESCSEQGDVATALYYILKVLSCERSRLSTSVEDPMDPSSLILALRLHGWHISSGEQDAHELFHLLMVTLEEEAHKASAAETGLLEALEPKHSEEHVGDTLNDSEVDGKMDPSNGNRANNSASGDSNEETQSLPSTLRLVNKAGNVITRVVMPKYDCNRNYQASPFCGMLTSQLQCVQCGFKSVVRFDKFDSLSLHLPESGGVSAHRLSSLLLRFTRAEAVTGVACEGCNKDRDPALPPLTATNMKTLSIGKLPKCLCIHIHRMSLGVNGTPYKRGDYVDFPEFLIMDPYTHNSMIKIQKVKGETSNSAEEEEEGENKTVSLPCRTESPHHLYRLKAVVVHCGSTDGGHFVTYRRGYLQSNTRHRSDRWYFTSDETVKDSTLAEAMQATAYMLFYEKCALTPT